MSNKEHNTSIKEESKIVSLSAKNQTSWVEFQLLDEMNKPVANMPYRAINDATKSDHVKEYTGNSDASGIIRIEGLHHLDLTLFIEAQPLADEMEKRLLSLERVSAYQMKMAPINVDKESGCICYYTVIGQLCDKAPNISEWADTKLPKFHFPDPDFSGLLISNMYFNTRILIKICPFRAWSLLLHHTKEYSIVNAMNLGLMADFAYSGGDKINKFFNHQCLDLSQVPQLLYRPVIIDVPFSERYVNPTFLDTSVGDSSDGDTQLFYISNQKQILIAWRGTEPTKFGDISTDATFRPIPCPAVVAIGRAHKGFLNGFERAQQKFLNSFREIEDFSSKKELFICGHSLGGALTLIHAATLKNYNPVIYTYGMPRTFTATAVSSLQSITHYRHVNDSDSVTSVPPEAELDNTLYDLWGPLGTLLGFRLSLIEIQLQAGGVKFGDPYWHHGNVVAFFKAEQSVTQSQKQPILWIGGGSSRSPNITVAYKSKSIAKLYLVPSLNESISCLSEEEQKTFIHCLDPNSLNHYFPKNSNPNLDSLTNPMNHLMSSQYMPFVNNQLIELIDTNRSLERKRKRQLFAEKLNQAISPESNTSKNEVSRNRLFLSLQDMLPATLLISESDDAWKNALTRFKNVAEEAIEKAD